MNTLKCCTAIGILLVLSIASCKKKQEQKTFTSNGVKASPELSSVNTFINTLPDTATIHLLVRQGAQIQKHNPDSAIALYEKSLRLSQELNYPEGAAVSSLDLANAYGQKKNYSKATYYHLSFESLLRAVPSPFYTKKFPGHRYLLYSKEIEKANSYYKSGNFDTAVHIYTQVITELGGKPDSSNYHLFNTAYQALSGMYSSISDSRKSLYYIDRQIALGNQYNDSTVLIYALTNKAVLFANHKDGVKGLPAAKQALAIARAQKDTDQIGRAAYVVALCLLQQQKADAALPYSKMNLQAVFQKPSEKGLIDAYSLLGYNYNQMKKYKRAESYLLPALQYAQRSNAFSDIKNISGQLAITYEATGRYNKALQNEKLYVAAEDTLQNIQNARQIADVETRYRVAQKDKDLAQKDKALLTTQLRIAQQQKALYLWIGGSVIGLLLFSGLLYHRWHKATLDNLKAFLAGEEKERARMARELHDGIVSRLSIIKMNFSTMPLHYQALNKATDFQEIMEQFEQSINDLRTASHNLLPAILQQVGLAEAIHIYCNRVRKTGLLDIEFQIVGTIPALTDEFQLNIYRIIQELIQNVIKHSSAKNALIQFQVIASEQLIITFDDDSVVSPADVAYKENGIGLHNLKDRIHMLNGKMEIEHGSKGTSLYLEFSLKKFI